HSITGTLQMIRIAQQNPACATNHAPLRDASDALGITAGHSLSKAIRLVDANAVDHLAAIHRHDVKAVIDDCRLGTVRTNLLRESRTHVHHHRLDSRAAL